MRENGSTGEGWDDYRRLLLQSLEDAKEERSEIRREIRGIRDSDIQALRDDLASTKLSFSTQLTELKVKMGIYGSVGGAVAAGILTAIVKAFSG